MLRLYLYQDRLLRWSKAVPRSLRQRSRSRRLCVHLLLTLFEAIRLDVKFRLWAPKYLLGLAVDHDAVLANILLSEGVTPLSKCAALFAVVVGPFKRAAVRVKLIIDSNVGPCKIPCSRLLCQHAFG